MNSPRKLWLGFAALLLAAGLWLPSVHLLFTPSRSSGVAQAISPQTRALAQRHLDLWTDPKLKDLELARMRRSNAEWDFMGRSFLVWSLAEMGLREPEPRKDYLPVMDQIIDD